MSTNQDNMSRPPSFVDPTTVRCYELTGKIRNHRRGRRRTQLVFYVEPNSASGVESRGLDPAVLNSLSTFVFSSSTDDENEQALESVVCLSEFEDGEKGRLLHKFNHRFHVD